MLILVLFVLIPLTVGFLLEYLVCRFTMRHSRWWKAVPPLLAFGLTAWVGVGRYLVWTSRESPLPTLLLVPGLPALFGFLGLLAGWRLWRRRWLPKVL